MRSAEGKYQQKDSDDYSCPECGGKLVYEFGTVRCKDDDWFVEDGEIEELFDIK